MARSIVWCVYRSQRSVPIIHAYSLQVATIESTKLTESFPSHPIQAQCLRRPCSRSQARKDTRTLTSRSHSEGASPAIAALCRLSSSRWSCLRAVSRKFLVRAALANRSDSANLDSLRMRTINKLHHNNARGFRSASYRSPGTRKSSKVYSHAGKVAGTL